MYIKLLKPPKTLVSITQFIKSKSNFVRLRSDTDNFEQKTSTLDQVEDGQGIVDRENDA